MEKKIENLFLGFLAWLFLLFNETKSKMEEHFMYHFRFIFALRFFINFLNLKFNFLGNFVTTYRVFLDFSPTKIWSKSISDVIPMQKFGYNSLIQRSCLAMGEHRRLDP